MNENNLTGAKQWDGHMSCDGKRETVFLLGNGMWMKRTRWEEPGSEPCRASVKWTNLNANEACAWFLQENMILPEVLTQSGHTGEANHDRSPPETHANHAFKVPPPDAIQAYRANVLQGMPTQTKLAEFLTNQLGRPISQGQVSRWLKQVHKFLKAGNILPEFPAATQKPIAIDPERLDIGRRQDGRIRNQRQQRIPEDD